MSSVAVLNDCVGAIDWYKKVLGARQRLRLDIPGGAVAHCELLFAESVLMVGSPMPPQFPAKSASFVIYVRNCDATFKKAVAAGASSLQDPAGFKSVARSRQYRRPLMWWPNEPPTPRPDSEIETAPDRVRKPWHAF